MPNAIDLGPIAFKQYPGSKPLLFFGKQRWNAVKGCDPEMISRTYWDHNLWGLVGQLATGKLQGGFK